MNGGMGGEKVLGGSGRLEALDGTFSSSNHCLEAVLVQILFRNVCCSVLKETFGLLPRCAMCGRLPVGKGFVERFCKAGRCGHVFDLLERCS